MAKRKKQVDEITIKYCRLGKEKAYGIADHSTNTIEIDSRIIGKKLPKSAILYSNSFYAFYGHTLD